jgi:hypothetical protein
VHGCSAATHGVIHRETAGHDAARRVDIEVDGLLRIFRFQEQQLGADQGRQGVIHLAIEKDDPLAQEAGVNIERPLSSAGLLHDHGDELHRFAHRRTPICLNV